MDNKKKKATKAQRERIENMLKSGLIDRGEAQRIIAMHSDPRLAFWEERFPGKGIAIMEILRPFYGWNPRLKPALPNLEMRAKQAVFWRKAKSLRVAHLSELDSLGKWFWTSLGDSLGGSFWTLLWDSLRGPLPTLLWDSLGASLLDSFRNPLGDSLFYACIFVVLGKSEEAAKLKPLLELWLAGNYPVGFDEGNNLLVLVADE